MGGSAGPWGRPVVLVTASKALPPRAPVLPGASPRGFLGALCLCRVWQNSLVAAGASGYCSMNI